MHTVTEQKIFLSARDHVDDGIADADDIVTRVAQGISPRRAVGCGAIYEPSRRGNR
jgi:hypothetical protein